MILNSVIDLIVQKNYFAYIASDSLTLFICRQKFVRSFYFFNISVMVNQQPSKVDIAVCLGYSVLDLLFIYRFIFHVKKALSQSEQSRA